MPTEFNPSGLLENGGPILWLQAALAFFGAVFVVERLFFFHRARLNVGDLVVGLSNHVRRKAYAEAMHEDWANDVLRFWFEELRPEDWFERKDANDESIRSRFAVLYEKLTAATSMTFDTPEAALAAILVFDQFPRNMFRGQPRAFATDDMAAAIARRTSDGCKSVLAAVRHEIALVAQIVWTPAPRFAPPAGLHG